MILSPAPRALDSQGFDPRVTLTALAYPGLISVVAPRLVDADIVNDFLPRWRYLFGRRPTRWTRAAGACFAS
jgi:hypothetical protein